MTRVWFMGSFHGGQSYFSSETWNALTADERNKQPHLHHCIVLSVCVRASVCVCVCVSCHHLFSLTENVIIASSPVVYRRERETRCACTVGRRLTQSLWSSSYPALSWMCLMCPWHFLSLLDTPLPAGGGQVLVMLSRTNLLSRCLVLMFLQRTATHTHR